MSRTPSPPAKDLGANIQSAYIWTVLGSVAKSSAGFLISLLLARLLEPKDYGLVGEVLVVITILSVQESGIGSTVVYFRDEENLPTYFSLSLAFDFSLKYRPLRDRSF